MFDQVAAGFRWGYGYVWDWLANYPKLKDTLLQTSADEIIKIGSIVILWQWRWIFVKPLLNSWSFLFSSKFRDLRKISGNFYMYHAPLMPELGNLVPALGRRIRVSKVIFKVSRKGSKFYQLECIGEKSVGYAGVCVFRKEFIFISADGVMSRYATIRKFISLYRPLTRGGRDDRLTMIGNMIGVANNHNIYYVPVLLCRIFLKYEDAEELIKLLEEGGTKIHVHKQIRERIKKLTQAGITTEKERFDTPFI